jgi:molybdopterin-guanine dinucleotide biosynthesis adapter protein
LSAFPPPVPSQSALPPSGIKAIAIVGPSNSGKTELICGLLVRFTAQGLKVAVLKHTHKEHLGDEGKDTWRYRQAGGQLVALAAPGVLQVTRTYPSGPPLAAILSELAQGNDFVLVEGYKTSALPKLGVLGPQVTSPLPDYPNLVAWVSPVPLPTALPVFDPRHLAEIGEFIQFQLGCRSSTPGGNP